MLGHLSDISRSCALLILDGDKFCIAEKAIPIPSNLCDVEEIVLNSIT